MQVPPQDWLSIVDKVGAPETNKQTHFGPNPLREIASGRVPGIVVGVEDLKGGRNVGEEIVDTVVNVGLTEHSHVAYGKCGRAEPGLGDPGKRRVLNTQ